MSHEQRVTLISKFTVVYLQLCLTYLEIWNIIIIFFQTIPFRSPRPSSHFFYYVLARLCYTCNQYDVSAVTSCCCSTSQLARSRTEVHFKNLTRALPINYHDRTRGGARSTHYYAESAVKLKRQTSIKTYLPVYLQTV